LYKILNDIEDSILDLQQTPRLSQPLLDNPFLSSVRQRLTTPAGTCSFDLPAFHAWLHLPHIHRQVQLKNWLDHLGPLEKGIQLSLDLLRKSSLSENVTAIEGRFEKNFNPSPVCQLIRLELPAHTGYFPEISGSKYCMHVRFMCTIEEQKPTAVKEDIPFRLTCCAF
jgi:cell division protein ZapD